MSEAKEGIAIMEKVDEGTLVRSTEFCLRSLATCQRFPEPSSENLHSTHLALLSEAALPPEATSTPGTWPGQTLRYFRIGEYEPASSNRNAVYSRKKGQDRLYRTAKM